MQNNIQQFPASADQQRGICLCTVDRAAVAGGDSRTVQMNTDQTQIAETHIDGVATETVNGVVVNEHRKVWAADEIPFGLAAEIVRKGLVEAIEKLRAAGHDYPSASLNGYENIAHTFYIAAGSQSSFGLTLEGAIAGIEPPEVGREKLKAALRAELAALESEASK